jgi:hypothetical protein
MVKKALKKTKKKTNKNTQKKVINQKIIKITDHLTMGVLIACGIATLVLISSFMSATGKAVSGTPDTIGITSVLQSAELVSGSGTMKCSYACARVGKNSIVSSVESELIGNNEIITGDWSCLCGGLG